MGKVAVPQSDSVPQCGRVCRGLRIFPWHKTQAIAYSAERIRSNLGTASCNAVWVQL